MSEGWPDFWIRGKKIDLIDLVDTINLIKQINTIDTVNNLGTLNTINTVDTIQKINPQDTDNVVIDRIKLINTIETINTLDTINTINAVNKIRMGEIYTANYIRNGAFETGTLEYWDASGYAGQNPEIDSTVAYQGGYSVRLPYYAEIRQWLPLIRAKYFNLYFMARTDTEDSVLRVGLQYIKDDTLYLELSDVTIPVANEWVYVGIKYDITDTCRRISFENMTDGSNIWVDAIQFTLGAERLVYQAEKDRTITPYEVETSGEIAAADNTSGYSLKLNKGYAQLVQFMVYVGGAAEIYINTSPNDVNYATLWTKSMTSAGWYTDWDFNAFPYFQISVPTTGIDVKIWIRAVQI